MGILPTSQVLFFIFILLFPASAISGTALECQISPPANEGCSPHVLLESGQIILGYDGFFELVGVYTACYHAEKVTIKGQLQRRSYPGGLSIELLATRIEHNQSGMIEKFPRTIGIITLQEALLQGRFVDTWAPLRSSSILQPTPSARQISCISADK